MPPRDFGSGRNSCGGNEQDMRESSLLTVIEVLTKGIQVICYLILIISFKTYLKFDLGVFFFFLFYDLKESLNFLSESILQPMSCSNMNIYFHLSSHIASKQLTLTPNL